MILRILITNNKNNCKKFQASEGKSLSACCGATMHDDSDICPECGEHSDNGCDENCIDYEPDYEMVQVTMHRIDFHLLTVLLEVLESNKCDAESNLIKRIIDHPNNINLLK